VLVFFLLPVALTQSLNLDCFILHTDENLRKRSCWIWYVLRLRITTHGLMHNAQGTCRARDTPGYEDVVLDCVIAGLEVRLPSPSFPLSVLT
jgi:hypothetical protein